MNEPPQTAAPPYEAPHSLATLQAWMRENGVETIVVGFHGYGDEGEVEMADIAPRHARSLRINGQDLEKSVVDFGDEILNAFADGWEDDEGASGSIHIEPGMASLNFGKRSEEIQWGEPVDLAETGAPEVAILHGWMKENGVRGILVSINGYNDEGVVEVRDTDPPEARNIQIAGKDFDHFMTFLDELLSRTHGDWEDDLGGEGGIEFTQESALLEFGRREERFRYEERALVPAPEPETAPSP